MMKQLLSLVGFVALSFAAPAVSAILSVSGPGAWYRELNKPWFNPPDWIFGPVWSFLYCAMGVAAWLVWRKGDAHPLALPLGFFLLQLVLNALWTPLFFGMHRPGLALIDIMAMWVAIGATTVAFYPVSKMAALLFIPYWLWVSFASMLNAAIWWLNRVQ
jgi:tryptophan-rich sensory protein